ncbi:MAG: DNA repair protein RecN [Defluviitaleaceae bacterium]|nr:DNA repair protein RecN [Defluviitaleaceae bacterium]
MLQSLHIKNIALIEEAELRVGEGLNILSGETGAGKSMIIDSLGLILGGKADKDIVRAGQDTAMVTAVFDIGQARRGLLTELGADIGDDDMLIITRQVSAAGKGSCRINGTAATATMLKQIGAVLVDIHGQHEHQSLSSQPKHMALLDKFAETAAAPVKDKLAEAVRSYREVSRKIAAMGEGHAAAKRLEMLTYQEAEIEGANLAEWEEQRLENRRDALVNSVKIRELAVSVLELLHQSETSGTALDHVTKAEAQMQELAKLDAATAGMLEALSGVAAALGEACRDIHAYAETLTDREDGAARGAGTAEIDRIEARLDQLHGIKKKYGGSVAAALEHLERVKTEIQELRGASARLDQLNAEKRGLTKLVSEACGELSEVRKRYAEVITAGVGAALADLGMPDAVFEVEITRGSAFGANGFDRVEFMLSANKGEPPKPLAKIASGGEMSRVMLALKSVLADTDDIGTFIFDEIDSGISGRTAQMVAEKLSGLARGRQIICITHLPQIAALADTHFLIEKYSEADRTRTSVTALGEEDCVHELARLTGGAKITEATMAAAREMKRQGRELAQQKG